MKRLFIIIQLFCVLSSNLVQAQNFWILGLTDDTPRYTVASSSNVVGDVVQQVADNQKGKIKVWGTVGFSSLMMYRVGGSNDLVVFLSYSPYYHESMWDSGYYSIYSPYSVTITIGGKEYYMSEIRGRSPRRVIDAPETVGYVLRHAPDYVNADASRDVLVKVYMAQSTVQFTWRVRLNSNLVLRGAESFFGDIYYDADNLQAALELYMKAESKNALTVGSRLNMADCYASAGFNNNAISELNLLIARLQELNNPELSSLMEEAYYQRGSLKILEDDFTGLEDLEKGGTHGRALALEIKSRLEASSIGPDDSFQTGYAASGSGFAVSTEGYIATNYHVVDGASVVDVAIEGNLSNIYHAEVVMCDKANDLAIIKIPASAFSSYGKLPYALNSKIQDVGTTCYSFGYPMANTLGTEIKVTDGIISSKSGYQGDIVTYQISAAIQPGSSGGPLFDDLGNIVGITNAGVQSAQNVGYAIKASYLRNLLEMSEIDIPSDNSISSLNLPNKVKKISPFVVLVLVK